MYSVLNVRDKRLYLMLLVDGVLMISFILPGIYGLVMDLEGSKIQLGEFLTISGAILVFIYVLVFFLPISFSIFWVARRLRNLQ